MGACGSADVLEALGIRVDLSPADGAASLRKHHFAFFHAPSLHPAMKAVMPVSFTLDAAGKHTVAGQLAFSVCTEDKCLMEKRDLLLDVVAE